MAGISALDLQRAQQQRVVERLNRNPAQADKWIGTVADMLVAERNMAKLQTTLRETFGDAVGDAMVVLRARADAMVAGKQYSEPETPRVTTVRGDQLEQFQQRTG